MRNLWICIIFLVFYMPLRAEDEMVTMFFFVPSSLLDLEQGKEIQDVLEQSGITFANGSSATYNDEESALIVKNSSEQMKLVDSFVEELRTRVEKSIFLAIFEISFQRELSELLAEHASENDVMDEVIIGLFDFPGAPEMKMKFVEPVYFDSMKLLRAEMSKGPDPKPSLDSHRLIKFGGTFSDPESQIMLRRLKHHPSIGITRLPSLQLLSGQQGMSSLGARRYGVDAVLSSDEGTIDIALFMPEHGKALALEKPSEVEPTLQMTIPDGHMAVVAEKKSDGDHRLVFIRSMILDHSKIQSGE